MSQKHITRRIVLTIAGITLLAGSTLAQSGERPEPRWFKGNTHTHTWWSDADTAPEVAVKWYKDHGYNFLVLSDHNIMADHEKWWFPNHKNPERQQILLQAVEIYVKTFGPDWVEQRTREGRTEYRLKTLAEFRPLFEEAGKFLLIPGEELSDSCERKPIHVNGVNLKETIKPPGGKTVLETIQNNIDAVMEQRKRTGQPMIAHLNHPNFGWAVTVEDLMRLRGDRWFEVHNGHPMVHNYGDDERPAVERMWDIALARRLTDLNLGIMYGMASDDAHNYVNWEIKSANPGRGWVMVRSRYLTPQHIVDALERGDFYATTGVVLDDVRFADNTLELRIQARPGVSYKTQFIGTLKNFRDSRGSAAAPPDRSNPEIGKVLSEVSGTNPKYTLTGQEIYVRAKVISDAKHPNPFREGDVEVAWTQPVTPGS